jgi:uncharacterized protein YodC (DUF2158 family)
VADFQKGNTVRLKSGGPIMTIETIDARAYLGGSEKDHARCQWFEKNELETGVFPLASLEAAVPSSGFPTPYSTR